MCRVLWFKSYIKILLYFKMSYITRHNLNNKFIYKGAKSEDLPRIKSLGIPPMWTGVKIDKSVKSKILYISPCS